MADAYGRFPALISFAQLMVMAFGDLDRCQRIKEIYTHAQYIHIYLNIHMGTFLAGGGGP